MEFALRANVKDRNRNRRGEKDRTVKKKGAHPGDLRPADRGMKEHTKAGQQKVGEVRSQVRGGLDLNSERQITAPDGGQQFLAGLDRALRPAMLLRLEAVHVDRQFRRRDNIREKNKFPARELGAITQI